MKYFAAIVVICFVQGVLSQVYFNGQCPKVVTLANFNENDYQGVWYAQQKLPFTSQTKCTTGQFVQNGNSLSYLNKGKSLKTGQPVSFSVPAKYFGKGGYNIQIDSTKPLTSPNIQVVGTDYKNWTAATWCVNINNSQCQKVAFTATRTRQASAANLQAARNALKSAGVDISRLVNYDQTNC